MLRIKDTSSSKSSCKGNLDPAKLNQLISERAYFIWEEKGRKPGTDAVNWLQAEKEILARMRK